MVMVLKTQKAIVWVGKDLRPSNVCYVDEETKSIVIMSLLL